MDLLQYLIFRNKIRSHKDRSSLIEMIAAYENSSATKIAIKSVWVVLHKVVNIDEHLKSNKFDPWKYMWMYRL